MKPHKTGRTPPTNACCSSACPVWAKPICQQLAARIGRLVPLFHRLPHRHALHGRIHRRQRQGRSDESAVPARSADVATASISAPTSPSTTSRPSATYLGKPGDPAKGGLPMAEYRRRQAQFRQAEISRPADTGYFIDRAQALYGYPTFHLRHRRVDLRMGRR